MLDPRDVLLEELEMYYNADELSFFFNEGLEKQADESAERMVHILSDRAIEIAELMREIAANPKHTFHGTICEETMYNWVADPESWTKFQILAQRMSDRITNTINKPDNET